MRPGRGPIRLLVLACVLSILVSAGWWLYHSPWVTVQNVEVSGAESVDPQAVVNAAGVSGQNIFRADLSGARTRVEALPQVKSASVSRSLPNTVKIVVNERQPAAFWMLGGRRYVVDADGVVLAGGLPPEGAPIIEETTAGKTLAPGDHVDAGALDVANRLLATSERSLGMRVVNFQFQALDGLTAVFDNGLRVTFGDMHDFDYKVSALYLLMRTAQEKDLTLHAVDLRFGDRLTYR